MQVAAFLASIFWDFNTTGALSPYFGLGVGVSHIRIDDDTLGTDNRDGAFAYQLGIGVSFNMSENTKFDVGYKMLGIVEPNLGPLDPDYVVMHNGNAALRFLF
jgi:opacity protein-like surface antigen